MAARIQSTVYPDTQLSFNQHQARLAFLLGTNISRFLDYSNRSLTVTEKKELFLTLKLNQIK